MSSLNNKPKSQGETRFRIGRHHQQQAQDTSKKNKRQIRDSLDQVSDEFQRYNLFSQENRRVNNHIKFVDNNKYNGLNGGGTFQNYMSDDHEPDFQKIKSQEYVNRSIVAVGEGEVRQFSNYHPRHIDLHDFNDYSSNPPIVAHNPYIQASNSAGRSKLPATISNSRQKFVKKCNQTQNNGISQLMKSHNGKIRDFNDSIDLTAIRNQLEQSKSQLNCFDNQVYINNTKGFNLQQKLNQNKYGANQQSRTKQRMPQTSQWKNVYAFDNLKKGSVVTGNGQINKLRLSENLHAGGTLFHGSQHKLGNPQQIDPDILNNSQDSQELPNIVHSSINSAVAHDNITVINKNVTQNLESTNQGTKNLQTAEFYGTDQNIQISAIANDTVISPNQSSMISPEVTQAQKFSSLSPNGINHTNISNQTTQYHSNFASQRPQMPPPILSLPKTQYQLNQNRSGILINRDIIEMRASTLASIEKNLKTNGSNQKILANTKQKDKIWFAGVCVDLQPQNKIKKKKKVSIDKSESLNRSKDTQRSEMKPWQYKQSGRKELEPIKIKNEIKREQPTNPLNKQQIKSPRQLPPMQHNQNSSRESNRLNKFNYIQNSNSSRESNRAPQQIIKEEKGNIDSKRQKLVTEPPVQNLTGRSQKQTEPNKLKSNRKFTRNINMKTTSKDISKEDKTQQSKSTDDKFVKHGIKSKQNNKKDSSKSKDKFKSIEFQEDALNINIKTTQKRNQASQLEKNETFGKKSDKQLFEKSVDNHNDHVKSSSRNQVRQKNLPSNKKQIIKDGKLISIDSQKKGRTKSQKDKNVKDTSRLSVAQKKKDEPVVKKVDNNMNNKIETPSLASKKVPLEEQGSVRQSRSNRHHNCSKDALKSKNTSNDSRKKISKNTSNDSKKKKNKKILPPPEPSLELIEINNGEHNIFSNNNQSSVKSGSKQTHDQIKSENKDENDDLQTCDRLHNKSGVLNENEDALSDKVELIMKEENSRSQSQMENTLQSNQIRDIQAIQQNKAQSSEGLSRKKLSVNHSDMKNALAIDENMAPNVKEFKDTDQFMDELETMCQSDEYFIVYLTSGIKNDGLAWNTKCNEFKPNIDEFVLNLTSLMVLKGIVEEAKSWEGVEDHPYKVHPIIKANDLPYLGLIQGESNLLKTTKDEDFKNEDLLTAIAKAEYLHLIKDKSVKSKNDYFVSSVPISQKLSPQSNTINSREKSHKSRNQTEKQSLKSPKEIQQSNKNSIQKDSILGKQNSREASPNGMSQLQGKTTDMQSRQKSQSQHGLSQLKSGSQNSKSQLQSQEGIKRICGKSIKSQTNHERSRSSVAAQSSQKKSQNPKKPDDQGPNNIENYKSSKPVSDMIRQEMGVGSEKAILSTITAPPQKQFVDIACGNSDYLDADEKTQEGKITRIDEHSNTRSDDNMTTKTPKRVKPKIYNDTDWKQTAIYNVVEQLFGLKVPDRVSKSKQMIDEFLNPNSEDIYTEEEAGYYYSFLRRKISNTEFVIDDNNRPLFEKMYLKAKLSVKILSEHLNLTIDDFNDNHEVSQVSLEPGERRSQHEKSPRQPIIFRSQKYKDISMESLIKLLLRIKQLYWAIQEIIKILSIILKLKDLIGYEEMGIKGQIYEIIEKYDNVEDKRQKIDSQEEYALIQSLNKFVMVSRRISRFLKEHKLFKHFVFGNSKYQMILLEHATNICGFFRKRARREIKQQYGEAFISDFLEFNEVEVEESEIQNLQDADERQEENFEMEIENMFDRSQHSDPKEIYKSDFDLRKPKKDKGPYHFGMLSVQTDSQDNIQTVNNDGSFKIQRNQLFSIEDLTNKSNIQKTEYQTKGCQSKNDSSPRNTNQNNKHKILSNQFGVPQELLSNDSKTTFIIANPYQNMVHSQNTKSRENTNIDDEQNPLSTVEKEDQKVVNKEVDQDNLMKTRGNIRIKDEDEESTSTVKQPKVEL